MTAQYLVWYLALLPAAMPANRLGVRGWLLLFALWGATHVHWIVWADRLENVGESTFAELWLAGLCYFFANVTLIVSVVLNQAWMPVVGPSGTLLQYLRRAKSHETHRSKDDGEDSDGSSLDARKGKRPEKRPSTDGALYQPPPDLVERSHTE